jgi:hypothetical protein
VKKSGEIYLPAGSESEPIKQGAGLRLGFQPHPVKAARLKVLVQLEKEFLPVSSKSSQWPFLGSFLTPATNMNDTGLHFCLPEP